MRKREEAASNLQTRIEPSQGTANGGHQQQPRQQQQPNPPWTTMNVNGNNAGVVPITSPNSNPNQIPPTKRSSLSEKVWEIIFLVHLLAITILIAFLAIRGFARQDEDFHPKHWHLPLSVSTGCSVATAVAWVVLTVHHPGKAITASLWLAPLLTCAVGILLTNTGTGVGLAFGLISIVSALVQSLYACWVASRLEHARDILLDSVSAIQSMQGIAKFIVTSIVHCFLFSGWWLLGVGGVVMAAAHTTRFAALYMVMLLLSLAWTMQVIRNVMHVAASHMAHLHLAHGVAGTDAAYAFKMAYKHSKGSICLGSVYVPAMGTFRGLARTLKLVAGGSDEFLFSCANCFMGVADSLIACGNRWGFVHVGAYQKGFIHASRDVWQEFMRADMEALIDTDLTSSFCFMAGVAGGMLCALLPGIWTTVVDDKNHTTPISIYAFLVGYFTVRVVMALPQACVSAYHVVYAENPQNPRVNQIIARRIRELQR